MATTYTVTAQSQLDAATAGKDRVKDGSTVGGSLLHAGVQIILPASYTAADIVGLVQLPGGSTVIPELCVIYCEDPGTAFIIDIGDDDPGGTADPNRYCDTLDLSAGGEFKFNAGSVQSAAAISPYSLIRQAWINAVIDTATTLTAAQIIQFSIVYKASN